jgi:hypothetical protein
MIQEGLMAVVHCRYDCDHPEGRHPGDGYVLLHLGAFGVDDAPGDALDGYHKALPHRPCSCGYDPLAPVPDPVPDGRWRPGHP